MQGVTAVVDCVKCVPVPVKKQNDPPQWENENWSTHPLPRAQKLMNHPFSAPPTHPPPNTFRPVPYAGWIDK